MSFCLARTTSSPARSALRRSLRRKTTPIRRSRRRAAGELCFERMSNIARGAPKAQIDEDEESYKPEPIDIPRFLNRQNNQ